MQPYFFPYLGHFALIAHTDRWIVFDVTQYTPRTWMNRNRILHPSGGPQYITVALANSSISIKTSEARVLDMKASRQTILGKLSHYRHAPFYAAVKNVVEETFDAAASDSLVALNVSGLKAVCRYLGISFNFDICAEMALDLPADLGPGEWAPAICAAIGAKEYVNPAGGAHLFNPRDFEDRGVGLKYLQYTRFDYATGAFTYVPDLSVIDAMMWNDPQRIVDGLREGTALLSPNAA